MTTLYIVSFHKLEASLNFIVRPCLKQNKNMQQDSSVTNFKKTTPPYCI